MMRNILEIALRFMLKDLRILDLGAESSSGGRGFEACRGLTPQELQFGDLTLETCGYHRTAWWASSNCNAQNCSSTVTYRRMPWFAVAGPRRRSYNSGPGLATSADLTGERHGGSIFRHAAIYESSRRPAGFVEGNRGVPQPRRNDRPTVGEA